MVDVEKYTYYRCGKCRSKHIFYDDANQCCSELEQTAAQRPTRKESAIMCPNCGKPVQYREEHYAEDYPMGVSEGWICQATPVKDKRSQRAKELIHEALEEAIMTTENYSQLCDKIRDIMTYVESPGGSQGSEGE